MRTVTYEMHDLGCIELTLILSVGFASNLWIKCQSLVGLLNKGIPEDVIC